MGTFIDQCISIANSDYSLVINGKIKSAVLQSNEYGAQAFFELTSQGINHKITLNLFADYVNSARVTREPYKPLAEILKTRNMSHLKKGDIILKNAEILAEEKHIGISTAIIPSGNYTIVRGRDFFQGNGYFIFLIKNGENKEIEFEVYLENGKETTIKHKPSNYDAPFKKFCESFKVLDREIYDIEYKDKTESETLVYIRKSTEEDDAAAILEKIQALNSAKGQLIHSIQSSREIFFPLLYDLIDNQGLTISSELISEKLKTQNGIILEITLDMIIQMSKEIGIKQTKKELLMEILKEANYSLLVNKKDTIDTVRIITLLSESDQYSQLMKGKDIIFLTGSTGAGKSVSVDYFMGIPMEKFTNSFGDVVVRINKDEYNEIIQEREIAEATSSKIGQSIGTSETIYSQGHSFIKGSLSENLEKLCSNVILCDNPGFNDTRGSAYEICTNLSIDQAIQNCRSIKALVLVVPYQAITLDKANHLIQLIALLQERFPDLLQEGSPTNNCFHILVTKWISHKQIDGFRDRIQKHLSEERELIENLQNTQSGLSQNDMNMCRDRLKVFTNLLRMKDKERIRFIDVEDTVEKDGLLARYLDGKETIPKESYAKAFEGSDMQTSFSNQISTSADTWINHILLPYFEQIPQKIAQDCELVESYKKSIEECKNNIIVLKNTSIQSTKKMQDAEQDLINLVSDLERIKKRNFTQEETKMIKDFAQKPMEKIIEKEQTLDEKSKVAIDEYNSKIALQRTIMEHR